MESPVAPLEDLQFLVYSQKVELDIDLTKKILVGRADVTLLPQSRDSNEITLNARQCRITSVTVQGIPAAFLHHDPFKHCAPFASYNVHQYHLHQARINPLLRAPPGHDLAITLPPAVKITEEKLHSSNHRENAMFKGNAKSSVDWSKSGDISALPDTPATATAIVEFGKTYNPIHVVIDFEISHFRDGLQFVGVQYPDARYPHVYTRASQFGGSASCIFPCVDDPKSRCLWEISITCPRTLGDALADTEGPDTDSGLTDEEKALDMVIVCSGDLVDDIVDPRDETKRTVSFATSSALSPNQIGFAIGPFELVDLSDLREIDEDEKLGLNAAKIHAFCLPGRGAEVRNTCMPLAKAIDFFTTTYTLYPFNNQYRMCFIEDAVSDTLVTAGLTLCSTRLLFPNEILDPISDTTRTLVQALASQWAGMFIVPRNAKDSWVIVGAACFMADTYLKTLFGNNDHRHRQKLASDKVCQLDVGRPSLSGIGAALRLDPSELKFLSLKAGVVFFILDRRLTKTSGSSGLSRIINRLFQNAKSGEVENTLISDQQFERLCEKMGHLKLDDFFQQWVQKAGCPRFDVRQSFNKKKLVVNLVVDQTQSILAAAPEVERELDPRHFMREIKEDAQEIWAGERAPFFKGPMTIRIHEADGTPYEHIVEIKEAKQTIEIPYNTKYKRLKRGRGRRERKDVSTGQDGAGDGNEDSLLYCLGDVLQEPDECTDWQLGEWPQETENKMSEESYEWIRMDADFEWICTMNINMPAYMFTSQLQQDRDVVAQPESIRFLANQPPHPLVSTFLLRTLMDRRYFHGVRTKAAQGLVRHATEGVNWIGLFHLEKAFQDLFCVSGSSMTKPNDFSDRSSYIVRCAIAEAMATIKDSAGHAPLQVKRFFVDKLKFNDNSANDYSDCYYLCILMRGLAESLTVSRKDPARRHADEWEDEDIDFAARREAINEIERYRRIDEWVSSYQNIFSRTALDCLCRLSQSGVFKPNFGDILQYTRPGNADIVRAKAFDCLSDLKVMGTDAVLKYFLHSWSVDSSPFMRAEIWKSLTKGIAYMAMGEAKEKQSQTQGGLLIEQEVPDEAREADFARRHSVDGAISALKKEVASNSAFKAALWATISSRSLSPAEIENVLDLCNVLFDPEDRIICRLRYPRYWRVENLGGGRVRFSQLKKWRTHMIRKPSKIPTIRLSAPKASTVAKKETEAAPIAPSIQTSAHPVPQVQSEPAPRPVISAIPTAAAPASSSAPRKSKIIRLRISAERLRSILDDDVPLRRSKTTSDLSGATGIGSASPNGDMQPPLSGDALYGPIKYVPRPRSGSTVTDNKTAPRESLSVTLSAKSKASTTGSGLLVNSNEHEANDQNGFQAAVPVQAKKRKSSASQADVHTSQTPKLKKRKSEASSNDATPSPGIPKLKIKLSKTNIGEP